MPGVTKEQIQAAREADLFAWLQSHEPGVLKRDGPNYRHKEHDSLVYVTGKRYWYWNSRGRSINALDYLIQIRGYGLVDAVQALAGGEIRQTPAYQSAAAKQAQREPEKKPFTLPWARRCATAAVSYLQRRGISSDVISRCFRNGLFYEARYHGEPVCVFVGKDNAGKAKFACMRGITGNLKKDVYGSDKEFSFCYPCLLYTSCLCHFQQIIHIGIRRNICPCSFVCICPVIYHANFYICLIPVSYTHLCSYSRRLRP